MKLNKITRSLVLTPILILYLFSLFPTTVQAADIVDSGSCGFNLEWTLDSNGCLSVNGEGGMWDYKQDYDPRVPLNLQRANPVWISTAPWYKNRGSITSVSIAPSVTHIGSYAFYNCAYLTKLTIPDGVLSIGKCAFQNCTLLLDINLPASVTKIEGYTFQNCENLIDVTIPGTVVSVGNYAFADCDSLRHVIISDGVMTLGSSVFDKCEKLTDITLPDSITSIGACAFSACKSLTDVTLPNQLSDITNRMFDWCTNLTTITIPRSVKSIGYGAFSDCPSLSDIYYAGDEKDWNAISIDHSAVSGKIDGNQALRLAEIHYNSASPASVAFADVPADAYYAEAVNWAIQNDVTNGTGTDNSNNILFSPNATVTRAQAVTFLWRAAGWPQPVSAVSPFVDVTDANQWYYPAVLWAVERGITNGVGDNRFDLEGALTYDQILTFLCRTMGDDAYGDDWSQKAQYWASINGLTDGLSFSAKSNCPRCDTVYVLWKGMAR